MRPTRQSSFVMMIVLFNTILILVSVLPSFIPSASAEDWPTFRGDIRRTGYRELEEGPVDPAIIWTFETGDYVYSSPVFSDGKIYVGSGDHNCYCLDATTGDEIWRFGTSGVIQATVTVAGDYVYVPSYDGFLYKLDAVNGDEIWSFDAGGGIFSSPAVESGMIVIGNSDDSSLIGIDDTTGTEEWRFTTTGTPWASAAIQDDRIYVGAGPLFYCLNLQTGSIIWSTALGEYIISSAAVYLDEIYVATTGNNLPHAVYLLDGDNGGILWRFEDPDGGGFFSSPAISERKVVIGSDSRKVFCLEMDSGAFLWDFETTGIISSSPAIIGDSAYIGSDDGGIYCLDMETGTEQWVIMTDGEVKSSPCVAEGMLWVGSWDHNVYCIGEADPLTGIEMIRVMDPGEENMSADENFTLRGVFIARASGTILSWHYSHDRNESNAQIIYSGPIMDLKHVYDWDTSDIPEGTYYIMAKLESENLTIRDWSEGSILVRHEDDGDEFIPFIFTPIEFFAIIMIVAIFLSLFPKRQTE